MGVIYKIEHYLIIFMVNYNRKLNDLQMTMLFHFELKYANTDYPCY